MANTTITFRTDEQLKKDATALFEALGMNLSVAINMFLKQSVLRQQYPCSLELNIARDAGASYPPGFFSLFGAGDRLGFDEEPADPAPEALSMEVSP
ncbi:MAG: type II toxin-antitoxin system RelB/DinJ family antitoxin [Lachnospiraceae bacterium]|nr:type II toxin-antitoxin system RelB/DinJ family antitoxin [Lachnospiraceae bacterium]